VLVAVEVKLRRSRRFGRPVEAIDPRRLGRLRRSLAAYAAATSQPDELRIDLVAVEPAEAGWRLTRTAGIDRL
jgi:Holliday junction resolvase-like predicted endonuclease